MDYRGHRLHEIPPNGQGIAALIALGILRTSTSRRCRSTASTSQHLQIEAMKLAFADAYALRRRPAQHAMHARARCSTTPTSPSARAADRPEARAGLRRRQPGQGRHDLPQRGRRARHDGELHPEQLHGLRLGRRRAGLRACRCRTAATASRSMPAARTASRRASGRSTPSSRPSSRKDGQPQMSFGVMGGNMQPQGHLQTLVRMLDHRQQPQAACDAPRWRFNQGLEINVEATMDAGDRRRACVERGHRDRGDRRQLPGLRRRPVHLAPRRSGRRGLRRGERSAPRRAGRGF